MAPDEQRKADKVEGRENRNPDLLPQDVLDTVRGRVLDPATALSVKGVTPEPTAYVGTQLLIAADRFDATLGELTKAAGELGWTVEEDPNYPPPRVLVGDDGEVLRDRQGNIVYSTRARTPVLKRMLLDNTASKRALNAPDAWALLQQARSASSLDSLTGVGLDHVISVHAGRKHKKPHWDSNPFWDSNPLNYPLASYALQGSGGRQPVGFAGERPARDESLDDAARPVVAILDTGCGEHPWLEFVKRNVSIDGEAIGYVGAADDPEIGGDYEGPLDGGIDPLSGHGTFIAGLVHQTCPDANIISWRVVDSDGPIVESHLVDTLEQVVELVERHAAAPDDPNNGGQRIDVLNLSMGYYHETPDDRLEDPTMRRLLERLGRCGTAVICSAGNDATARKLYPAAFAPTPAQVAEVPEGLVPITSVGADNPNGTVALFSNTGPWVRCYAVGASVLSTMPAFQGGLEPLARTKAAGLDRESLDPDDYHAPGMTPGPNGDGAQAQDLGGFALWSGTSFAAPVIAGRIAARLLADPLKSGASQEDTVSRARKAVEVVVQEATSLKGAQRNRTS